MEATKPAAAKVVAPPATEPTEPAPKKRNTRRIALMVSVPLILAAIGGYLWLSGGRYASTDNAYVQQDKVTITAQVSGRIVHAPLRENDVVATGDVLFQVDPEPYRIALASANAALASARLQVEEMRAAYQQATAAQKAASDDLAFRQKTLDRQQGLLDKGVASQATFDETENSLHAAEQALAQANERASSALTALGGDASRPTDEHPAVLAAMSRREQAALDLANTTVTAPADGVIAQADRLLVGQQVNASTAVLSLVETGHSWVEANFKETDLEKMAAGQAATVTIDAYPGKTFQAEVGSIGAGTGSEFSILPAQNATGNWVKVVQRVPVRIQFTGEAPAVAMRTGLSASVSVDTESAGKPTGTASTAVVPKPAS